jgi:hypothetical protein
MKSVQDGEFKKLVQKSLVYEKINLSDSISGSLGKMILKMQVSQIPSSKFIENWKISEFGCEETYFQFKIGKQITETNFMCLDEQNGDVEFVGTVNNLITFAKESFNLSEKFKAFQKKLESNKAYYWKGVGTYYKEE